MTTTIELSNRAQAALAAIAEDRRSGSGAIAERAAAALETLAAAASPEPSALEQAICELAAAQPEMAVLLHLADRALAALSAGGASAVREAAARFRANEESARAAIASRAVSLLTRAERIITLSASGTVAAALSGAAGAGLHFEVVVGESRPAYEGRDTAAALARTGLAVTVMVDAALPGEVRGRDAVVVGADRVGWDGFVNKVGTRALVGAAAAIGAPAYVLTPSTRFVAERVEGMSEESERPGSEVWEAPPPGVAVRNRTFEPVPWGGVSRVVIEDALLRPAEAAQRAMAVKLDPRLAVRRLASLTARRGRRAAP